MNPENFDELLDLIKEKITKQDTQMRQAISPELKLAITLRYLATGNTFTDLAYYFRVHRSTISKFIPDVCDALYEGLKDIYLNVRKIYLFFETYIFMIYYLTC